MEIREIIVALGVFAIIVILIDGVRRMKIKIPTKTIPVDDDYQDPEELARKAQVARELPNGGARVVREMSNAEQSLLKQRLNLRERVPMLMERVEVGEERAEVALSDEARQKAALQSELDFTQAMTKPMTLLAAQSRRLSRWRCLTTLSKARKHPNLSELLSSPPSRWKS